MPPRHNSPSQPSARPKSAPTPGMATPNMPALAQAGSPESTAVKIMARMNRPKIMARPMFWPCNVSPAICATRLVTTTAASRISSTRTNGLRSIRATTASRPARPPLALAVGGGLCFPTLSRMPKISGTRVGRRKTGYQHALPTDRNQAALGAGENGA